eukprot:1180845-Prorocentrum_minimum.AAC.1
MERVRGGGDSSYSPRSWPTSSTPCRRSTMRPPRARRGAPGRSCRSDSIVYFVSFDGTEWRLARLR